MNSIHEVIVIIIINIIFIIYLLLFLFLKSFVFCPMSSILIVIQYRALAPMYYRGAAAAVIVYDITQEVIIAHWLY